LVLHFILATLLSAVIAFVFPPIHSAIECEVLRGHSLLTSLLTALYHPLITHICFSISFQAKSDPSVSLCFFLILLILIALSGALTPAVILPVHTLTFPLLFYSFILKIDTVWSSKSR
jgi:hypothetical protein